MKCGCRGPLHESQTKRAKTEIQGAPRVCVAAPVNFPASGRRLLNGACGAFGRGAVKWLCGTSAEFAIRKIDTGAHPSVYWIRPSEWIARFVRDMFISSNCSIWWAACVSCGNAFSRNYMRAPELTTSKPNSSKWLWHLRLSLWLKSRQRPQTSIFRSTASTHPHKAKWTWCVDQLSWKR